MKSIKIISFFLFISIALFSLSAVANPGTVLKEVLSGKRPAGDITIIYKSGPTTLTILGSGATTISSKIGKKSQNFQGTIDQPSIETIFKTMVDDKYWTAKSSPGRLPPGSQNFTIQIKTKQGDLNDTFTYSDSQAMRHKETQTIVRVFRSVIKAISRGAIKY